MPVEHTTATHPSLVFVRPSAQLSSSRESENSAIRAPPPSHRSRVHVAGETARRARGGQDLRSEGPSPPAARAAPRLPFNGGGKCAMEHET
eukprot:4430870-Pleurochrysis_carterae.AAC.3